MCTAHYSSLGGRGFEFHCMGIPLYAVLKQAPKRDATRLILITNAWLCKPSLKCAINPQFAITSAGSALSVLRSLVCLEGNS